MSEWIRELRLACRRLRRTPGFTVTALLTLAVGIGATTSVFSVVNGVLLHPLPHPDAQELVALWETNLRVDPPAMRNNVSVANYGDWMARSSAFEGMAAHSIGQSTLSGVGEAEMVTRGWVTEGFFSLLRARTALGRVFTAEEDTPDGPAVAVLSHDFWRARFGGDRGVMGRTLELNGVSFEVIGVLEEGVDFLGRQVQLWTPYGIPPSAYQDRGSHSLQVLARLKPGVTVAGAQGEMDGIADAIRQEYPEWMTGRGVNVIPLVDEVVGQARPTLVALFAGVVVMLLIAALNVANLLLIRVSGQRRDLAVRRALGCTRARLLRESLLESLLLGITGGGAGLLMGVASTRVLMALAPDLLPRAEEVGFDAPVLFFALGTSLLLSVSLGFLPHGRSGQPGLSQVLKEGGRGFLGSARRRTHQSMVVAEVAFSMVLLVAAGLLARSFLELRSVDPGFATENVLTAKVRLPARDYPDRESMEAFYEELLSRVQGLPQVSVAGFTRFLPMSDGPWTFQYEVEGHGPDASESRSGVGFHAVAGDYFRASGIPLRRGRVFDRSDNASGAPVVIVNETMARRGWPSGDALGRRMRFSDPGGGGTGWRTVVGIVADVRHEGLGREAIPTVYGPLGQAFPVLANRMRLVARTSGDPLTLASNLRGIVGELDPDLPLFDIRSTKEIVSAQVARPRFSMMVLAGFSGVAALLAIIGVYGVVSYSVGQRTQEMGLRMALGANGLRIIRVAAREGLLLGATGIGAGTILALGATRLATGLLFGVGPADPLTYGLMATALGTAATLACLVPAARAARVDPLTVLRGR